MNQAELGPFDAVQVVLYLLVVLGLGLWMSWGVKSSKDFFLAGKSLPWWDVALSLIVSDIGAKDMVGLAGDSYRYGVVTMNFDLIGQTNNVPPWWRNVRVWAIVACVLQLAVYIVFA